MAGTQSEQPRLPPARPEGTQAFMDPTGFCVTALAQLVHGFRRKIRTDACLGPAFTGCIAGWTLNPERMVSFWPLAEALTPVVTPVPLIGRRVEGGSISAAGSSEAWRRSPHDPWPTVSVCVPLAPPRAVPNQIISPWAES